MASSGLISVMGSPLRIASCFGFLSPPEIGARNEPAASRPGAWSSSRASAQHPARRAKEKEIARVEGLLRVVFIAARGAKTKHQGIQKACFGAIKKNNP